jgi:hypothetical protein
MRRAEYVGLEGMGFLRRHRRLGIAVVVLGISGLLLMHGLDPATFEVTAGDAAPAEAMVGESHGVHGTVGLCFMVVAASLALVLADRPRWHRLRRFLWLDGNEGCPAPFPGRARFLDLCVMRL